MPAIYIPNINPLHFTQDGYVPAPQYNSKHIRDHQFEETILPWQTHTHWFQPFQKNDSIKIQVLSDVGPVEATIMDKYNNPVFSAAFQQMQRSFFQPTMFIYQLDLSLGVFLSGYYRLKISFGSPITATVYSNPFEIQDKIENTLLLEYKHHKYYADAYFENGWNPSVRIYGTLVYEKPGSKNAVYENQESDMTLIDTKPFDTWRLFTGSSEGIPDWAIMKYNLILGCSTFKVDGRQYTKATDGTSFEQKEERDYPMRGWSIELRDKLNRASRIMDANGVQNVLGLTVSVNVETKGFVSDDVGGSFYEVQDIE
jgi:hypothetical protein